MESQSASPSGQYVAAALRERIVAYVADAIIIFILVIIISSNVEDKTLAGFMIMTLSFYHLIFEVLMKGQSPGKRAFRIKVVSRDGSKASFGQYVVRWLMRLVDVFFSVGILAMLVIGAKGSGQRLGDWLAGTKVVSLKAEEKLIPHQDSLATAKKPVSDIKSGDPTRLFELRMRNDQHLTLFNNYLTYGNKTIHYKDMHGLSFHIASMQASVYLVPVLSATLHRLKVKTGEELHTIQFFPSEIIEENKQDDKWKEQQVDHLYQLLHQVVKPFALVNLLLQYAETHILAIGAVSLSTQGIAYKELFGSGAVTWNEYHSAGLQRGNICLYKEDSHGGKRQFLSCSSDEVNAILLPDLIRFLKPFNGEINGPTKDWLLLRKADWA